MRFIKKKILVTLLFIVIFCLGYIRESFFLVINTVIYDYPFPYNASYIKPPDFLYKMGSTGLISMKWVLTFLFSILFMGVTLLIVNLYFKYKRYNIATFFIYCILLIIAFLIALIGYFIDYNGFYTISRLIAGLLQSPILSIFLFVAFYISNSKRTT